ncbi:MAG: T9SS type A sorting domain-containing protein [Bacteroidota bacterium]
MIRLFTLLVLSSFVALADPSGKTGFTSKTSTGCGTCHGGNAGAAVTVTLNGPRSVKPGEMVDFSVVVGHASARSAGISITVRSAPTAPTGAVGTLSVAATGSGLRVRTPGTGQEITQAAPKTIVDKQVTFNFSWTAPVTPGSFYVLAVANAVNGNGGPDNGDDWTFLEPVEIKVESATSVEDVPLFTSLYPNPLAPSQILRLDAEFVGPTQIRIMNMQGSVVIDEMMDLANGALPRPLAELPRGVYMITATGGMISRRGTFIIE